MSTAVRILMVEDDEIDAELTHMTLKRLGLSCEVRRVDEQESFVAALHDFTPQLIISDLGLPRFDGFQALALARQLRPEVPFIFSSGSIGQERAEKALQLGASWHVEKGDLAALGEYVKDLFGQRPE